MIHCGGNEFIVVDSFLNPATGNPVALDYIQAMGFSATAIKRIVLTHWHQDHTQGIHQLLIQADSNSKLVISPIIQKEKFQKYISLGIKGGIESTNEFAKVMNFIFENKNRVKLASQGDRFFAREAPNKIEAFALSPQDKDLIDYIESILLPDEKDSKYIFPQDNNLSIVILIKFDGTGILLGSDLENKSSEECGWKAILTSYDHDATKSSIYKIPHHGSINAHNDDVWDKLLIERPCSVVSVFNKTTKLPTENDISRIIGKSGSLFVVGKAPKRDKEFQQILSKHHKTNIIAEAISTEIGMVRYRCPILGGKWSVEQFGAVRSNF